MNILFVILINVLAIAIGVCGIVVGTYCEHNRMLGEGYRKSNNIIDEEKLDKLAEEFVMKTYGNDALRTGYDFQDDIDTFKAGYRKAKEK